MTRRFIIGTETQSYQSAPHLTGIQRVVRETHGGLVDRLAPLGFDVVPVHTREDARPSASRAHRYLSGDPVLESAPLSVADVEMLCFLDLNMQADFPAVYRVLRESPRPVIALVYDLIPLLDPSLFGEAGRRQFRMYVQQVLRIADHLVVTSDKVKQDLHRLGWYIRGEIHVIPLGSTFRARAPVIPQDDRLSILYVSTVEARKGHALLLDAYDILRNSVRDVDLTLVGMRGSSPDAFYDRITCHPDYGGRLRWLMEPDDLFLVAAARRCTVGAFPSPEEGFGLFIEEGLALGLKMVARDIPVFRERPQANLYFHDPTPEALAGTLAEVHALPWEPPPERVRSMHDFVDELADLIVTVAARQQSNRIGRVPAR